MRVRAGLSPCRRRLWLLLWMSLVCLVPYLYIQLTFPVRYIFKHSNVSSACIIPHPDPFDPSILKFVWDPKPFVCDPTPAIVYTGLDGTVYYNQSALKLLHLSESQVQCQYRTLIRSTDDINVAFSDYVDFKPPFKIATDLFHVTCRELINTVIFDQLLTSIDTESVRRSVPVKAESPQQLSVMMFGLDSVSRSAAIRKMPKTFRYLTNDLNSYDFKGYMKVGENTLPNVVAILTGLRVWTKEVPTVNYLTEPFDPFPFLWRNFSEKGYATLYADDMPEYGMFTYYARGFHEQPTDHYFRPFWVGINQLENVKTKLSPVFLYLENKNVHVQKSSSLCYKNKPKHVVQLDYLKQFVTAYRGKRKFMFSMLAELCHEYPNFLANGDEDFLNYLKWLKDGGHLDNTILIFFSDHGARIDEIRNTFVGRIEVRMPLMQIVVPDRLKSAYPFLNESLTVNTQRLSVPFDVHQMLIDVLSQNFEKPTTSYVDGRIRGQSLLKELPVERSCADAWVPENYCACYTSSLVNISNSNIGNVLGDQLLGDINKLLSSQPKCAQLSLHKIQALHEVSHGLQHSNTENTGISFFQFFAPEETPKRYDISVIVSPGHGVFDATYEIRSDTDIKLLGNIIRANRYGDQPCIDDKQLRSLCFCYD